MLFEMSMLVKSISLKSQTSSLPFNVEPIPAKSFMVSMACKEPIIPVVAPKTPRVLQDSKSASDRLGIKHSRQPVSGGANTERLPSMPMAAPKT